MKHYLIYLSRFSIATLVLVSFGCEKIFPANKIEYWDNHVNIKDIDTEELSDLSFTGISSITSIADSSVRVHWPAHAEAIQYEIYRIQSNSLQLLKSIEAPASTYVLNNLANGTAYTFRVNLRDNKGLKDRNTNDQTFNTLTAPAAPNAMANQSPGVSTSFVKTPTIRVGGVKAGDTIKLYSEITCTTEIGSGVATADTIDITTSKLALGTFLIHTRAIGIYNNRST
jgi:hypothetical protein